MKRYVGFFFIFDEWKLLRCETVRLHSNLSPLSLTRKVWGQWSKHFFYSNDEHSRSGVIFVFGHTFEILYWSDSFANHSLIQHKHVKRWTEKKKLWIGSSSAPHRANFSLNVYTMRYFKFYEEILRKWSRKTLLMKPGLLHILIDTTAGEGSLFLSLTSLWLPIRPHPSSFVF